MDMENLLVDLRTKNQIVDYYNNNHLIKYESEILKEMLTAIESADTVLMDWFSQFGDSIRCITMNVHAHRKSLEFGFDEIGFDQHGWFIRPEFLERENVRLGNSDRYGEYSIIYLGRGANQVWTYSLDYAYGCAGGGSHISVYGKQFKSRDDAFYFGLNELKSMMTAKIGNKDTTNFKQPVIMATLAAITKAEFNRVQLSLF